MKLFSHLMKLLHLITLSSQQFYLCGTLFNVHDTLMKHALRLALETVLALALGLDLVFREVDILSCYWYLCALRLVSIEFY